MNLEHSHVYLNLDEAIQNLEFIASNCFDGCTCTGVGNYSALSKYIKNKNSKVVLFSEGPDEFLGGYVTDVDAHKIDNVIGPGKPFAFLKYFLKINSFHHLTY